MHMTREEKLKLYPKIHPTKIIPVQNGVAEVDELMIPLVQWINSFSSAETNYCCQGDSTRQPYVVFKCKSKKQLKIILSKFKASKRVLKPYNTDIFIELWEGDLRFYVKFHDTIALEKFNRKQL